MEGHNGHGGVFKYLRRGQNFVCSSLYYFSFFFVTEEILLTDCEFYGSC